MQIKELIRDILKAFLTGLLLFLALAAAGFVFGFLTGGKTAAAGIETAKNLMYMGAAAVLFILAGLIMHRGKHADSFQAEENGWRKHFRAAGIRAVFGAAAAAAICLGAILDLLQRLL